MRVRVVDIALRHGGKRFEIGEVIDLAEHPELAETVEARVRARTAEPVQGDGQAAPELALAIEALSLASAAVATAMAHAATIAEAGPPGSAQALIAAMHAIGVEHLGLQARMSALSVRAAAERDAAIEQVAPAIEAASDAAAVDGPAAASTQNSEAPKAEAAGSDTAVADPLGANSEDGDAASADGAGDPPASNDAPQPDGGVDGDAGAAPAAPVEPAAQPAPAPPPAASTRAKRSTAPKGGQKGA